MKKIAANTNEFFETVSKSIIAYLNTEAGREVVDTYRNNILAGNPNLTEEEWANAKKDLVFLIFKDFVMHTPEAMKELAVHYYNEFHTEQ